MPQVRFFEVWKHPDGMRNTRNGLLLYEDFDDWLTLKGDFAVELKEGLLLDPRQMLLRVVTCENVGSPHSLGHSQAFFERLRDNFNLLETTEEAFINNNGAFSSSSLRNATSQEIESLSLVIKVPYWVRGCEALSMHHDSKAGSTRVFMLWITDTNHRELVDFLRSQSDKTAYEDPLLLPSWVLRNHRRAAEAYRAKIDQSLLNIEHQIGYALPGLLHYKPSKPQAQSSLVEGNGFEDIVRRLHASLTELGALAMEANFGKELGAFLKKLAGAGDFGLRSISATQSESLLHLVDLNTNLYSTMAAQVAVLKERVQSHINLTFSLIAQEENKLSRTVAANSKRDSAAMKTIAVVTMFFLPPTFVATLFSMSMFNWGTEGSGAGLTSAYFWVYWAVAIPLTFLVVLVWRVWWKWEEKRYLPDMSRTK
ncbi:hypothetical protein K458DRAFT_482429 [Lentithecium fluviatile CBS 122367]|uniref:Uncharacterized protein n=1 Tax=Lentithecium fluviatile CBS 122367 TaxID=1168545 RepID=A0A6G1JN98_9PLEO|nr:hypothetical protein K458DRAFT_482429 [Lentithecium fluviatile CBS 122367]